MRVRIYYCCAIVIVIMLGISTREFSEELPAFVVDHFGDGLWASMIYLGFRVVLVRRGGALAVWASVIFCCGVEFSQLYQAEWINEIRSSTLGALVLGKGFLAVDFVRYGVGVGLTYIFDRYLRVGGLRNGKHRR